MRLKFSDLFVEGSGEIAYAPLCGEMSGKEVELRGWLSPAHDGSGDVMLVERPGECPDCSPVAAIALPGFMPSGGAVTLRGRLSYGFQVNGQGKASFLRLEEAKLAVGKIA